MKRLILALLTSAAFAASSPARFAIDCRVYRKKTGAAQ
jgi:hypothetical protein